MSTITERWRRLSRPIEQVRREQQGRAITWADPPSRKPLRERQWPRRPRQSPGHYLVITQYMSNDRSRSPDRPVVGITLSEQLMVEAEFVAGDRVALGMDDEGICWVSAHPDGGWSLVSSVRGMRADEARGRAVKSRVQFTAGAPFGPVIKTAFAPGEVQVRRGMVGFRYPFASVRQAPEPE